MHSIKLSSRTRFRGEGSAFRTERLYYIYILASRSRNLYIGVTNDIRRRVREHRSGEFPGYTIRYSVERLIVLEIFSDIRVAIAREKELKAWRREKKLALIHAVNPAWIDLAEDWFAKEKENADPSPLKRVRDDR
jgi:putative endonuclease